MFTVSENHNFAIQVTVYSDDHNAYLGQMTCTGAIGSLSSGEKNKQKKNTLRPTKTLNWVFMNASQMLLYHWSTGIEAEDRTYTEVSNHKLCK